MTLFTRLSDHLHKAARNKLASSVTSFDVSGITETINSAFVSAGLKPSSGVMKGVTNTIQNAFAKAGLTPLAEERGKDDVIEGVFQKISPYIASNHPYLVRTLPNEQGNSGRFLDFSFRNGAGARTYKLYIPVSHSSHNHEKMPLVVMLHGCTQSPDDFAAGTQMNALAEQHGFIVAYPCQSPNANGSKCWNWFRKEDQTHDRGEPSIIAGIALEIASHYEIDKKRIFIAGLSAGAAMAVVLGITYPEVFAGVGAHSGLPYGAAYDMSSAFSAMKGGSTPMTGLNLYRDHSWQSNLANPAVPTIMFHGDNDNTVNVQNGTAIIKQATTGAHDRLSTPREERKVFNGRTVTRTIYNDIANQPFIEQWIVHGGGHAWSGGSRKGSYTDTQGPDASAEMIRFFYSLNTRANA